MSTSDSLARRPPPSRRDNPFATCWTRPGALTFRFAEGQSADQLVARLSAHGWRGAIIGPHGSGKSTLLETLKPTLQTAGLTLHAIHLPSRRKHLPTGLLSGLRGGKNSILLVDGYEQLGWLARAGLLLRCCRAGTGLLVTAHAPTGLPTLVRLAPDVAITQQLVELLCTAVPSAVTPADVAASYASHGSNVREILFDLYDRHERLCNRLPRCNANGRGVVSRQPAANRSIL